MIKDDKYYNSLDKRTKEYKDYIDSFLVWVNPTDETIEVSKGVGDKVEAILKKTGIAKVAKFVMGDDCGCDERIKKLNAMFTFPVKCLNEGEYKELKQFFEGNPLDILPSEYSMIVRISNRVTESNNNSSMGCGGCVRSIVSRMKQIYETYGETK